MKYHCKNPGEKAAWNRQWTGEVTNIKQTGTNIEAEVTGRGSTMYIIIGKYEYGRYLCIPGWRVGCELAGLTDVFWNREQLESQMGKVDAITIAEALKAISENLESMA